MHARKLTITAVYGGVGIHHQAKQAGRSHVLVATPGRLLDLIERRAVDLGQIEHLVLDEADRMLDMGFKPVVDRIVAMTPRDRQTLLFSATLEGEVGRIAAAYTRRPRAPRVHAGPRQGRPRSSTASTASRTRRRSRRSCASSPIRSAAARSSSSAPSAAPTGSSSASARRTCRRWRCTATSRSRSARSALARFESGRISTLVATDVAARGIDVAGVTHVINYDAPAAREDYVHRIGRTARAGASGVGITFVMDDQARDVAKLATELGLEHGLGVEVKPRPAAGPSRGRGPAGPRSYSARPRRSRRR